MNCTKIELNSYYTKLWSYPIPTLWTLLPPSPLISPIFEAMRVTHPDPLVFTHFNTLNTIHVIISIESTWCYKQMFI